MSLLLRLRTNLRKVTKGLRNSSIRTSILIEDEGEATTLRVKISKGFKFDKTYGPGEISDLILDAIEDVNDIMKDKERARVTSVVSLFGDDEEDDDGIL